MPAESRSPPGRLRRPDSCMPAWIATCQASAGRLRCLPIEMISDTVWFCTELSRPAATAPSLTSVPTNGPRPASQLVFANAASAACSSPPSTTLLTTPMTTTMPATSTTATTATTTPILGISGPLRVGGHQPTGRRVDRRDVQVAGVGGQHRLHRTGERLGDTGGPGLLGGVDVGAVGVAHLGQKLVRGVGLERGEPLRVGHPDRVVHP